MAKRLRGGSSVDDFSAKCRVSCALDAACGLSHLHNMTPRQGGPFFFEFRKIFRDHMEAEVSWGFPERGDEMLKMLNMP